MEIFRRLGLAPQAARHRPAGGLSRTTAPTAPRRPASNCRAFRFRAGAIAIPRPTGPTPIGRPPSRRTGSTRSTWSRCCSRMPPPSTGLTILNRTAFEDFERRPMTASSRRSRDLDTGTTFQIACRFHRRLRRRALDGAQGDRRDAAGHADHPARAVDLYPRAATARPDGRTGVDDAVAQSAALRHGGCDRRPREPG